MLESVVLRFFNHGVVYIQSLLVWLAVLGPGAGRAIFYWMRLG